MAGVVQYQRHLREAYRRALLRSAEDHILHLAAPQRLAGLLAHDPANRVGDIGLAGAVRTDDGGDVLAECEHRFIGKRFKPLQFEGLQVHSVTSP